MVLSTDITKPDHSVTAICIDSQQTLPTWWYWHPSAPNFYICSRCFEDGIRNSPFVSQFRGDWLCDGQPRACRFSKPRIRDSLLKQPGSTGDMQTLVNFTIRRASLPDCQGVQGAKGSGPCKWFKARDNVCPNVVICETCYEDHLLAQHFGVRFEPARVQQRPGEVWVCGMSSLYIVEEYKRRADKNDWLGFVEEANARVSITGCPGRSMTNIRGRAWFSPVDGPPDFTFCFACYCDHIVNSGEQSKWRQSNNEQLLATIGEQTRCAQTQFNISLAMAVAHQMKDMALFRNAAAQVWRQPRCEADGITGHQRVQQFVDKAFCTFLTGNPAPFEAYVTEYASIPVCPRDVLVENRLWFGWNECTICPECHHDIVRVTTLANSMPLRGQRLSEPHMCEMYSPKMRQLYEKVSGEAPTDPSASELLEYAIQRRQLYHQLTDQKQHLQIKLAEHHALVSMSANFGTMGGAMHPLSGSNPYGASNISYGYALQGGVHSAQASVVIAELQQGGEVLIDLENRWKELE